MKNCLHLFSEKQRKGAFFPMLGRKRTIVLVFIFLFISSVIYAQDNQRLTVSMKNVPLKQVMDYLKEKSAYFFLYNDEDVNKEKNVTVEIRNGGINDVLTEALENTQLAYSIQENTVIISKRLKREKPVQPTEKVEMYGQVVDIDGVPVPGVSVYVKGTTTGVSTDADGKYRITVEGNRRPLVFSFVGMQTQEIPIQRGVNNIVLLEDEEILGELVVTGYQKLGVNQAAGSFNTINMKDFEKKISPSITSTLEGLSPSLVVSSRPGGEKQLTIRGVSTLSGQSTPLIIVDGFPYSDDLSTINPYDIEKITLLKDAASASIYGAKSANGVIVITTKRGKRGDLEVRYMSNTQISQKPDIDYLMNRVSSSDMVDIEIANFKRNENRLHSYQYYFENGQQGDRSSANTYNRTIQLYLAHKEGRITQAELDKEIALLRSSNNRDDLDKLLLQTPFYTEHSLSASYGAKQFRLRTSLNYFSDKSGFKGTKNEGVRYNLNSVINVSDKFTLDLLANFDMGKNNSYKDDALSFLNLSPYERFYDDAGNPLAVTKPSEFYGPSNGGVFGGKDSYEIQRIIKLGLLDETYYPASDYGLSSKNSNNWGARFQTQMRLNVMKGLDATMAFNINKRSTTAKSITDRNSWQMKSFINNLTTVTKDGKKGELSIPLGSRVEETRSEITDYLLRGQLDFNRTFGESQILALVGSEIQANKTTSTSVDRVGYDERNNFLDVDYFSLQKDLVNKFQPGGIIEGGVHFKNAFSDVENRYFSLYANSNYMYSNRYVLSASIRIDQSNLFGTDPKYRFKPFWSLGGKWRVAEEEFFPRGFFSKMDFQISYGINGNISNEYGPFDIAETKYSVRANRAKGLVLQTFAIPDLRWEQTGTFNVGIHTQMLGERISLSFDYYRKNTKDALAITLADPTLGAANIIRNDATIFNNGYEMALSTQNIATPSFSWNTFFNLNLNQSKVQKVYEREETAYFLAGTVMDRAGYAPRSLFVFDWAGVNKEGYGVIRRANNDLVSLQGPGSGGTFTPDILTRADLQYAGTTLPKFVMGLTNNLIYKNVSLSFMFVYQGGHVLMRDSYDGSEMGGMPSSTNMEASKAWKKPGDENNTVVPKWNSDAYSLGGKSNKNILPADFIRLRDIIFSYTFPQNTLKRLGISELTINLTGKNLFLWTKNKYGIDPETQGLGYRNFPTAKSFSAGLNVTF